MNEQANAELIAEASLIAGHYEEGDATGDFIEKLAYSLKSADQRAELAETNLAVEEDKNAGYRAKNEQLAAVMEKVRELSGVGATYGADEFGTFKRILREFLTAAPADALRKHDAALIEKLADEWSADPDAWGDNEKDYRNTLREKAHQRREGQS